LSEEHEVKVYLLDRAGVAANAFADKLAGREGVYLVGGAADVEEALDDIGIALPEVILVGTDLGGSGVVAAVERVLAVAPNAAVVALCTANDKALVAQAVRSGAAGSLDRTASPGETITALHVYRSRQRGEAVDMSLAEPPAHTMHLRVSGALPRFPGHVNEDAPYEPHTERPSRVEEDAASAGAEASAVAGDLREAAEASPPYPTEPPPPPPFDAPAPAPAEDDDAVAQLRQMLRQEAEAAAVAPAKRKRGFLGLFKGKEEAKTGWGPKEGKKEDGKDKETKAGE
jgi:DNA-binding NarL/FixJ family response regulator